MAKVPAAGLVKTRLAREIGVATTTRFARHATAALVARVARHPAWHTTLAITPDTGVAWRTWPTSVTRMPQGRGDLGQRMQRFVDTAPPGPVVIIGTDIPRIGVSDILQAFRLLGRHDAVFGPAADGGYWLVGFRRRPRVLAPFFGVRWSSANALADTVGNLTGRSIATVGTLSDVDTAADFARSTSVIGRRVIGTFT